MPPNNTLPMHGNDKTMNLNSLVLANIQASPYFKVHLFDLKTYHQVIDEIYYKVTHLEPWEKGSRKTAGQTGMCGGVRGVGTGGIVSSAFCLLFKLYTLKLTRKQLISVCTHPDSGYIRGLGLMYIRFTQPPQDLWEWYEPYLDDEEEVDVKAGGGHPITIGEMASQLLTKLEWYSTLFPRVPVPIQKTIEANLAAHMAKRPASHRGIDRNGGGRGGRDMEEEEDERDSRAPASSRRSPPSADRDRSHRDGHSSGIDGRRQSSPERRRSPHHRDRRPSREDDRTKRRSRSPAGRRDRKRSRSPVQRRRSPAAERKRSPDHRRRSPEARRRSPAPGDEKRDKRRSPERRSKDRRSSPVRVCNSRYERPRERDHSPYESDLKKELERVHKRDRR